MSNESSIEETEVTGEVVAEIETAHQSLAKEIPPVELDERILQAARASVQTSKATTKPLPYRQYSIAASICLSVLIVSMFMNNEVPTLEKSNTQSLLLSDTLEESMPVGGLVQENEFDTAADAVIDAVIVEATTANTNPQAQFGALLNGVQEQLVQQPELQQARQAQQVVAEESALRVQAPSPLLDDTVANIAFIAGDLDSNANAAVDANSAFLYRNTSEAWLLEIQSLLTTDPVAATEEITLFSEAYPEIEVELALSALTESEE